MVMMHDENMTTVIGKQGMELRDGDPPEETAPGHRALLLLLLQALLRRHRRFWDIYGWRGNPMSEYLKESMSMEREHIAELICMIQKTL